MATSKYTLDELERRIREEQNTINQLDASLEAHQKIIKDRGEQIKKLEELKKSFSIEGTQLSTIERLFTGLGALSTANASKATTDWLKTQDIANAGNFKEQAGQVKTFINQYVKDIRDDLTSALTGRQARSTPKTTYTDAFGPAGLILDIGLDPTVFMGGQFKQGAALLTSGIKSVSQALESNVPAIEKFVDSFGKAFNIFHEVEKNPLLKNRADLDRFFRVVANTDKFDLLKHFGTEITSPRQAQSLTNLGYSKVNLPGLDNVMFQGQYADLFKQAFISNKEQVTGALGKWGDVQSFWKQYVTGAFPTFHIRNAFDAIIKNIGVEGVKLVDYVDFFRNAGSQQSLLNKLGITQQTGMIGGTISNIPGKVANWIETYIARGPLWTSSMNKGMTASEAAARTEDIHYQYNSAYMTKFVKDIGQWADIWAKYSIGQFKYWPKTMLENLNKIDILGEFSVATMDDKYKENPNVKPEFMKNMFTIGNYGGFGSSLEDFLKMISGNMQTISGHINPIVKSLTELVTDWNVFKQKSISGDKSGSAYRNLDPFTQWAAGYNDVTGNVRPYMKYFMEAIGARFMSTYQTLMDPKRSVWDALFPVKKYEYTSPQLSNMYMMDNIQPRDATYWEKFKQYVWGSTPAFAQPSTNIPPDLYQVIQKNINTQNEWAKGYGVSPDVFNKYRVRTGSPGEQDLYHNQETKTGDEIAKKLLNASPDVGKNIAESHAAALKNKLNDFSYWQTSQDKVTQWLAADQAEYEMRRPRETTEAPLLDPSARKYRPNLGDTAVGMYTNKALEEWISFISKTGEIWRAAEGRSPEAIMRGMQSEIEGVYRRMASQRGIISWKEAQSQIDAITARANKAIEDLSLKVNSALANITQTWADAEVDGIKKVELERIAARQKYDASDEKQLLKTQMEDAKKNKDFEKAKSFAEKIKSTEDAIDAKYARKKQERLAQEAKVRAEMLSNTYKDEMQATIAALKGVWERGGLSIDEYFTKLRKSAIDAYSRTAQEDLASFLTNVIADAKSTVSTTAPKTAPATTPAVTPTTTPAVTIPPKQESEWLKKQKQRQVEFLKATGAVPKEDTKVVEQSMKKVAEATAEVTKTIEETGNIREKLIQLGEQLKKTPGDLNLMQQIYDLMEKATSGDIIKLTEERKKFADSMNALKQAMSGYERGEKEARENFDKAISEIKEKTAELNMQTYSAAGPSILGIRSTSGASVRYGKNVSPYAPPGFDAAEEQKKAQLSKFNEQTYQDLLKVKSLPGGAEIPDRADSETNEKYFMRVEEALRQHLENKANLTNEGQKKIEAIQEQMVAREKARNQLILTLDMQAAKNRLTVAGDMANMLSQAAANIYEMSGQKSKEAFYVMKGIALAEAMIKGTLAILNAYKAGSEINPYVGFAYAAIASAFVGTQIAMITKSMIDGPETAQKKAQGGEISGGSGTKDDVHILAMGGEYIIRKDSVKKYGVNFMEAINKGIFDPSDLHIPDLPQRQPGRYYAQGGPIAENTNTEPMSIVLENKSGVPLKSKDKGFGFDGKEYVRSIILDLQETDPAFSLRGRR